MRTDAKKNLKKVAGALVKNPDATQREIAKKTKISVSNVNDKLNKLEQNGVIEKNQETIAIAQADLKIVRDIQEITQKSLVKIKDSVQENSKNAPSIHELGVLNQISEKSQKRYSFLTGENSDQNGAETQPQIIIVESANALRNLNV